MSRKTVIVISIALTIPALFFYFFTKGGSKSDRYIGNITIPCLDSVHVAFYQDSKTFVQYQSLRYLFKTGSGIESEWHNLGGIDDFDGVPLSDVHVDCTDSLIKIYYLEGLLIDTYTIQEAVRLLRCD